MKTRFTIFNYIFKLQFFQKLQLHDLNHKKIHIKFLGENCTNKIILMRNSYAICPNIISS